MLGLGGGLTYGGSMHDTLVSSYTSDFTSDSDGWIAYSVQGNLTIEANQTIGGSDGWLKMTYDTNQTSSSGIRAASGFFGTNRAVGDYVVLSYKIYYVDDSGKWTGSDSEVSTVWTVFAKNDTITVSMDEVASITRHKTTPSTSAGSSTSPILGVNLAEDRPLANAVFYVKDIRIDWYRPI